jgi:hypothetical protein
MVYDTTDANNSQKQLLSPNEDFAGPGIGDGGGTGEPGENDTAEGKGIIISNDGNSEFPTARDGIVEVIFDCPGIFQSINLINITEGGGYISFYDKDDALITQILIMAYGENSFLNIEEEVTPVKRMTIDLLSEAVITELCYTECCKPPPSEGSICTEQVCEDFDEFDTGTTDPSFKDFSITNDAGAGHPMMIFDADNPTAGEEALGTPNVDFAGPGVGSGGGTGKTGENSVAQGKVLIISDDNDPFNPKSYTSPTTVTVTFTERVNIDNISILDANETGGTVKAYDTSDVLKITKNILNLGANSFQTISIGAKNVIKLEVYLTGTAAITELCYTRCKIVEGGAIPASIEFSQTGLIPQQSIAPIVWNDMYHYKFPGTNVLNVTQFCAIADPFIGQGMGQPMQGYEIRVYDDTNAIVVGGPLIITPVPPLPAIHIIVPIQNLSPGQAIWRVQMRRTGGGGTLRLTFFTITATWV